MPTERYRAVRHWRGPATVEADGLDYPVAINLSVVVRVDTDGDGVEQECGDWTWVAETRHLPRDVDGVVTVRFASGTAAAGRASDGLIVGDGQPSVAELTGAAADLSNGRPPLDLTGADPPRARRADDGRTPSSSAANS